MEISFINLLQMQIIIPTEPTAVERSAATELQEHLVKMSSVQLSILNENDKIAGVGSVYIGATDFAADHAVEYPDNKIGEGWAIKAVDGELVLCGGRNRGVLYAVYHLLEDVFGVHWWSLWDETVPTVSEALVRADYADSGVPAMEYRDVFVWPIKPPSGFAVRNRLNGWGLHIEPEFGGIQTFGYPAHVHTFDRYFPESYNASDSVNPDWAAVMNPEKEDYFKTHPEWFALTLRKKRLPKILCMSDEGLQKAFLDKLLKSIAYSYDEADRKGEVRPRYFDLSPADMIGECRCPRCDKSIRTHGSSGHQLRFVNKIAAEVKKVYPEVVMETIIYWHYLVPPLDDTKPDENVVVRYCNNLMDILHDIHHPNNQQYLEGLNTWSSLCGQGNMYIWDYGACYSPNGILPSMYKLSDNFRTFAQAGVNGYFLEIEPCITSDMWDMKVWMSTKLMEDPMLDQDVLIDTFLNGYYGVAAPYVRRYLDAAHARSEENDEYFDYGGGSLINGEGFSVEDIIYFDRCFEDAIATAGNDTVLLRRLHHARMGLDRVIVENYSKWAAKAAEKNLQMPQDEATVGRRLYETFAEQVALRGEWDYTGELAMKVYEKYLPDYVPVEEAVLVVSEEVRLSKLHGCKHGWKGNSPVIVPKEELENIPESNKYVFPADVDFASALKKDPDSEFGASACYDVAYKRKLGIISQKTMMERLAVVDNDILKCIPVGVYSGELDSNGLPISALWGTIRASDIVADGKYHLYKFPDVVAISKENGNNFHMFRDWSLQIYNFSTELDFLAGKKVDTYVSMKVTGDVSCDNPNNLPVYCVDKIVVVKK